MLLDVVAGIVDSIISKNHASLLYSLDVPLPREFIQETVMRSLANVDARRRAQIAAAATSMVKIVPGTLFRGLLLRCVSIVADVTESGTTFSADRLKRE